jgi:hypothetical protein
MTHRLLFVEVAPEEYQLLSYFGITKDILPQVRRCPVCVSLCAAAVDSCNPPSPSRE